MVFVLVVVVVVVIPLHRKLLTSLLSGHSKLRTALKYFPNVRLVCSGKKGQVFSAICAQEVRVGHRYDFTTDSAAQTSQITRLLFSDLDAFSLTKNSVSDSRTTSLKSEMEIWAIHRELMPPF